MIDTNNYEFGTSLTMQRPWATYVSGKALCSDGKVRTLSRIAITADTYFSVPASVKVNGKTVSGYITTEDLSPLWSVQLPTVIFRSVENGKNYSALPNIPVTSILVK